MQIRGRSNEWEVFRTPQIDHKKETHRINKIKTN